MPDEEAWREGLIFLEPGSRQTIPPHDVSACGRCEYVYSKDNIIVTSKQKRAAMIAPDDSVAEDMAFVWELIKRQVRIGLGRSKHDAFIVFLGLFAVGKNPGHMAWYLFQCANCDSFSVSYLQGYGRRLTCDHCDGWLRPDGFLPHEGE